MGKRARLKWKPRTRQPRRQVTTTQTDPFYGPANFLSHEELKARLIHRKAF